MNHKLKYIKVTSKNLAIASSLLRTIFLDDTDYDKALKNKIKKITPENISWIVQYNEILIGITGLYVESCDSKTVWLDWYGVIPSHRKMGFGRKILLDTIEYCKKLNKYDYLRLDTTYWDGRPAISLYDNIMTYKEKYTIEDQEVDHNWWIYTYSLKGNIEYWNNKYLGLAEFYDELKK